MAATPIRRHHDDEKFRRAITALQNPSPVLSSDPNHHRPTRVKPTDSTVIDVAPIHHDDEQNVDHGGNHPFITGDSESSGRPIQRIKVSNPAADPKSRTNSGTQEQVTRVQKDERREEKTPRSSESFSGDFDSSPQRDISSVPENQIEGYHWQPSPSAVPEVDALFSSDNPLIALAQSINMSFDPEKVSSGDFSELTDLFVKSAFFNNAAMIQQLPMLFGRSVRLSQFINQLEDDLFDPEKFKFLSNNQKILLLAQVNKAQSDITKGISRNSATIIQGMDVLPKLAAFSEELHKRKVMEVPEDDGGKAASMLKMIRERIARKAPERKGGDDE